ncbi:GTP pyrophosphokinase family protein [Limnobacter sp. MED105]|uniref:GTP pyrophosphokinase n=1 Tax=Limnobacter sp. MED105 TaxID=391597 RepID=UPI000156D0A3|nr:RelA/SpoT domain-containing protein [Limnobacter sp. MED105]EDM83545.1 RelA/SpoT [Limnobacter sp. MED105]
MTSEALQTQFNTLVGDATRLRIALLDQLESLFSTNGVTLGVPMEGRVKSWTSIAEKIERKSLKIQNLQDLDDFVGLRIILLFLPDVVRVNELLHATFNVLSTEDTSIRLTESQFGYQSRHYILRLPEPWLRVPSFAGLGHLKAEIQVRTLAQHIWAAASHKLQYKHEATVPPPLKRSIHRVSALLETIDLEFERLLAERALYVEAGISKLDPSEPLNVDIARSVLSDMLPPQNRNGDENYAELLNDLFHFGINTADDLRELLAKHITEILVAEAERVNQSEQDEEYFGTTPERAAAGVFFTHVGLARQALSEEFGYEIVGDWIRSNMALDD